MLVNPTQITGWVNTNLYMPTSEVLGILSIPHEIQTASAMLPYNPVNNSRQKHHFLAQTQGTHKAILPIHTPAEKKLFRDLMNSNPLFSPVSGEPRWQDAVKIWNSHADLTDQVFYKVWLISCCGYSLHMLITF